jgi:hypothetical protein
MKRRNKSTGNLNVKHNNVPKPYPARPIETKTNPERLITNHNEESSVYTAERSNMNDKYINNNFQLYEKNMIQEENYFSNQNKTNKRQIESNRMVFPINVSGINNKSPSQISRISNTSTNANINAIANCLGMDNIRAQKKSSKSTGSYAGNHLISATESKRNLSNRHNNANAKVNVTNNNNISKLSRAGSVNLLTKHTEGNITNNSKSNSKDNSCFIIFQKSNAKKLKKEIERYSRNSTFVNDNSLILFDSETKGDYSSRVDFMKKGRLNYNTSLNANNMSPDNFLSVDDRKLIPVEGDNDFDKRKMKYTLMDSKTQGEKDDQLVKEWLYNLGFKNSYTIDFTKSEILEFRDG